MDIKISKRLKIIANLVPESETLADIGCDHGLLCIYLIKSGRVKRAIAADIGKGPLENAKENIRAFGLSDIIETRLSDGLCGVEPGEVETIVIAGMGGLLMLKILKAGEAVWKRAKTVILSPQRDERALREYMCEHALWDTDVFFKDENKHYTAMRFLPGLFPEAVSERELILGLNPTKEYLSYFLSQKEKVLLALKDAAPSPENEEKRIETERIIGLIKNES